MDEKLPVLNLDPDFDLYWNIKTTNDLKKAWNACHTTMFDIKSKLFIDLVKKNDLLPYLNEADYEYLTDHCEDDAEIINSWNMLEFSHNLPVYMEKVKRYDEIVACLDAPESTSIILDLIKEVTEEPF